MTKILAPSLIVSVAALYAGYKYAGADDLRNSIYRPLYEELGQIHSSLQQDAVQIAVPSSIKESLETSGQLRRVPATLRQDILKTYQRASSTQADLDLIEKLQRSTSERVRQFRDQNSDAVWTQKTIRRLQQEIREKPGVSGVRSYQLKHIGHSPMLDVRDRANPVVSQPGDVRWGLHDWATFPESVSVVEAAWDDNQYLTLDDYREEWLFRITKEDLRRHHIDLLQFMRPIQMELTPPYDFRDLERQRREADAMVLELREIIATRESDPKRVSDLLPWN